MAEIHLAERTARLGAESAFEVLAAANALEAEGRKIIHLEIGEPDFPTARHIINSAKSALDDGYTTYCNAQGLPALREAIVDYARTYRQFETRSEEVVVAPGAKPIIFYTILVLVGPGDEVLFPDPGFPTYESVIRYAGGVPVPVVLKEENGFRLDPQDLMLPARFGYQSPPGWLTLFLPVEVR